MLWLVLQQLEVLVTEQLMGCYVVLGRYLQQEVFNKYHTETEMLRYIKRLESMDWGLAQCMIPLGSW